MSRKAEVYHNKVLAGYLEKTLAGTYIFRYHPDYFADPEAPAISLSFPKHQLEYQSPTLFPFFFGLLSEGVNKQTQCRLLKIDEHDHFSLLLRTAGADTIGAITVKTIDE
ncbi:HipA N-terminal domain-containing protein [Nafulsella turpanensis]|uniref:HipA N-terminal domain-containing protein n=1 Tax=Nafulsella turpanensis TaxID=1265690 RepID=UPI0003463C82|nr:HipA N-terminal domain-containing protein [Nafulsella turpanensis]